MSENRDRSRPWTEVAKALVLYRTDKEWRFAIYSAVGIMDGRFTDLDPDCSPEVPQARLLDNVSRATNMEYRAEWREDKPGWWSAELFEEGRGQA